MYNMYNSGGFYIGVLILRIAVYLKGGKKKKEKKKKKKRFFFYFTTWIRIFPPELRTIGVVDYLVVLIFEPLCSNMVRDAKVTSSILVWSIIF